MTPETLLTILEIGARCEAVGIAPRAFWAEACGGDMAALPKCDVERALATLAAKGGA